MAILFFGGISRLIGAGGRVSKKQESPPSDTPRQRSRPNQEKTDDTPAKKRESERTKMGGNDNDIEEPEEDGGNEISLEIYKDAFEDAFRDLLQSAASGMLQNEFQGRIVDEVVKSLRTRVEGDRIVLTGSGLDSGELPYIKGRLLDEVKGMVNQAHEDALVVAEQEREERDTEADNG